jgi:glyoxylase-like metal-dependent hydrolase (beta-lactamase superfamily II)
MSGPIENYRVYAIKYAHHDRLASVNFIGGDPHDEPMPLDYFVWAVVGESRVFVVDTGFDAQTAKQRGREVLTPIETGLKKIGIQAAEVEDVIITHMHYDHAGNRNLFPRARYHIQDREMSFCTGRCMCHGALRHTFEVDDVKAMVDRVFEGRVQFHDGASQLAPGLSVHWVGGHTGGLQVVRVHTERGWVVLASDASHLYANMEQGRPYPIVYNVGDMLEGYAAVRALADSEAHVIPGHDPDVLRRFPAHERDTEGWIARLDATPR